MSDTAFDFRVRSAAEFLDRIGPETDECTLTLFDSREKWLEGRKGHLGASDAFKVIGTESRKLLFEELTGVRQHEDLSEVEIVQRGVWAEQHIRALIAIENPDIELFDGSNLLFVSKRKPFMSATLDCLGIDRATGEVIDFEIKESPWSNKWKGDFAPDGYFTQLCHQSFVTGITRCVLHPRIYLMHDGGYSTSFERSYEYDMTELEIASQIETLVAEEEAFWKELESGEYRPRLNLNII